MDVTIGKLLSLVVALTYTTLVVRRVGIGGLIILAPLMLPLSLIWFAEEIGSVTGYFRSGYVNVQTPGVMVAFMGWVFLLGAPVLLYLMR